MVTQHEKSNIISGQDLKNIFLPHLNKSEVFKVHLLNEAIY